METPYDLKKKMLPIFRRVKWFLALMILIGVEGHAQQTDVSDYLKVSEIVPPSPNAAALGKYGGLNLGGASGAVSYSVPVYEFRSRQLSLPLSLNYYSNGFRVDEIASSIGTGWSLNVGGVITRTVRGQNDQVSDRAQEPADFPQRTTNLIQFMASLSLPTSDGGHIDGEPDLYSFNLGGTSGRFILDKQGAPFLLEHSGIKIESINNTFKITDLAGVQYFFGASGQETTRKNNSGTNCGKTFPDPATTAYYVTQIVHPNKDTINFSYETNSYNYTSAISQSVFAPDYSVQPNDNCFSSTTSRQAIQNRTCTEAYFVSGVAVKEVTSSTGGKMKFIYQDRQDGIGSKLITGIELYQPGGSSAIRRFMFSYVYSHATTFINSYNSGSAFTDRPFLIGLTEASGDSITKKVYGFQYNDLASLPPRLAYCQDYSGYFNGKSNTTLIPKPDDATWRTNLPSATADRNYVGDYAAKGLLSKIIYPTGGYDTIYYEGNTVYQSQSIYPATTNVQAYVRSSDLGSGASHSSVDFVVPFTQTVTFTGAVTVDNYQGCEPDPIHQSGTVSLSSGGKTVYSQYLRGTANTFYTTLTLIPGTYTIRANVGGGCSYASGTVTYIASDPYLQYSNLPAPGVRVAKVISSDQNKTATVKKYLYASMSDLSKSSAGYVYTPLFQEKFKAYAQCSQGQPVDPNNPAGVMDCSFNVYEYFAMHSNPQNNVYIYASPISYNSIIESDGDNFENGGVEHRYTLIENDPGYPFVGNQILYAPMTDQSALNGKETYTCYFKKQDTLIIPVKKVTTTYATDARINGVYTAYVCRKKYSPTCTNTIPDQIELNAYDLQAYRYEQKWLYPSSVTTETFNENGDKSITQTVTTAYDNPLHALPTNIQTDESDGQTSQQLNAYPPDVVLTGEAEQARQELIARHIIQPVLQQQSLKNGALLSQVWTGYARFNGAPLPSTVTVQIMNNTPEKRVQFDSYNDFGQIQQQTAADGLTSSFKWGYNNVYPVAKALNAKTNEILYEGFEEEGHWDNNTDDGTKLVMIDKSFKRTGLSAGRLDNATSQEKTSHYSGWLNVTLAQPTRYKWSGWVYSNGPSAQIFLFMKRANETGYFSYVADVETSETNKWVYIEKEYDVPADVTLLGLRIDNNGGGQVWFDDIRLFPSAAQMQTYTFDPYVGMTSQQDINNKTGYYEYDGLGRLTLVRDNDRNIVKKMCYNYFGQPENCFVTYYSHALTKTYLPTIVCQAGGVITSTDQTYKVADSAFTSLISQEVADSLANAYANANGPSYVNAHSSCLYSSAAINGTFSRACGPGYSTNPVPYTLPAGAYTSTINQEDANAIAAANFNARGQAYADSVGVCTELTCPSCTGADKKCIKGVCVTGTYVTVSSVYTKIDKFTFKYKCTSHYCFPDGTTSADTISYSENDCSVSSCPK